MRCVSCRAVPQQFVGGRVALQDSSIHIYIVYYCCSPYPVRLKGSLWLMTIIVRSYAYVTSYLPIMLSCASITYIGAPGGVVGSPRAY